MEYSHLIEDILKKVNHLKMHRRYESPRHGRGMKHGGKGHGFILAYLYYNGDKVQPSELGHKMDVSTPRVTAILNEMEDQGLIRRSISPENRRNIYVTLSDKGRKLFLEKLSRQRENIQLLLDRLDESDIQALIRILDVLDNIMSEHDWTL